MRLSRFCGVLEVDVLAVGRVGLVDLMGLVGVFGFVALGILEGAIVAVVCGVVWKRLKRMQLSTDVQVHTRGH